MKCVSCDPRGRQRRSGSATFGGTAGGTYDPAGQAVAMNRTGSKIFFDTPDPLVPQDTNTGAFPGGFGSLTLSQDVYEWENGTRLAGLRRDQFDRRGARRHDPQRQ